MDPTFNIPEWRNSTSALLSRMCTADGLGAAANANIDASVTPQYWEYRPAVNEVAALTRMIITVRFTPPASTNSYGNIIGGLPNGITVQVVRGEGVTALMLDSFLTDPLVPIRVGTHWATYCKDWTPHRIPPGDYIDVGRWTFMKAGTPVALWGQHNDAIRVILDDNFEPLVEHYFLIQGETIRKPTS